MNRNRLRAAAAVLAASRTALGVAAITRPELPARPWVGETAGLPTTRVFARALGGRDLGLGLGALGTLALRDQVARSWLAAGGLADAVDAAATVAAWSWLPRRRRWLVLAATSGAAATTAVLCTGLSVAE